MLRRVLPAPVLEKKMKFKIGDKLVESDEFRIIDGKKVPVIKATSEEIKHPDGRIDVIVHVPCLQIAAKENLGK